MSKLRQRVDKLNELKQELINGPTDRTLTVPTYLQLLDYHIDLLDELDKYIDAIKNDNQEYVDEWYKKRVNND